MKEVSIVGKSNGYKKALESPGEIWAVSSAFKLLPSGRVKLIFNLHKPDVWEPWLEEESRRVMTAYPDREHGPDTGSHSPGYQHPGFLQFPSKALFNKYGPVFGSTISWMMAFAIEQRYQKINIFGVDMATQEEYIDQRDTFFYMAGRAEERGIEIIIPEDSRTFFKDRMYAVME